MTSPLRRLEDGTPYAWQFGELACYRDGDKVQRHLLRRLVSSERQFPPAPRLRDVQDSARNADPRTTRRSGRHSRHASATGYIHIAESCLGPLGFRTSPPRPLRSVGMCGRYSNSRTNPHDIAARFEIKISDATAERAVGRTNVAPTQSCANDRR